MAAIFQRVSWRSVKPTSSGPKPAPDVQPAQKFHPPRPSPLAVNLTQSCLKCLCGDLRQEVARQQSRIMVNGKRILDGTRLPHHPAADCGIERSLYQCGNTHKADPAADEFGDRNLVCGVEHGGCSGTGAQRRPGEPERREALEIGPLER